MEKGIIVYQSKYGATKKYAEWLQAMTDYYCVEASKATVNECSCTVKKQATENKR